ncbi:MAG TPA: hypothetical protein VNT58_02845 [Gaiellaceae bacterium]|nr:hypothetical protein [Gaiellaceae bacterium]
MRELLEVLEASAARDEALRVPLAYVAGGVVPLDADEKRAAIRRAQLLLAAGGDPRRELEIDGRAVTALAADLDAADARAALRDGLEEALAQAQGLPAVEEALHRLLGEEELAWRSYASAILAEALSDD